MFSAPVYLAVLRSSILVADPFADEKLIVIDRKTGSVKQTLGRSGAGPTEFRSPGPVRIASGESSQAFVVYDFTNRRISILEQYGSEDADEATWRVAREITIDSPVTLYDVLQTSSGDFLFLGFFVNRRVGLFAADGSFIAERGPRVNSYDSGSPTVVQHAYQATLAASPSGGQFVAAWRHAGTIEMFDSAGEQIVRSSTTKLDLPSFRVGHGQRGPIMILDEDHPFGYVDVTATDSHIYALYSGRSIAEHGGQRVSFGDRIHVFDWTGEFIAELMTKDDLIAIDSPRDEHVLFGIRHEPVPGIVRIQLPNVRRLHEATE